MSGHGKLFIVSGPAGVGKTTVVDKLLSHVPRESLVRSVTATTRPPRQNEIDGRHYRFFSEEKFLSEIDNGSFLEYALVHGKYYYGSLKNDVIEKISSGTNVLLTIDVQGFLQILDCTPGIETVSIFIRPSDQTVLERRLRKRGTENALEIADRMRTAEHEISFANRYKYTIISGSPERDFCELLDIYTKENL
jgi:guanylate kinase